MLPAVLGRLRSEIMLLRACAEHRFVISFERLNHYETMISSIRVFVATISSRCVVGKPLILGFFYLMMTIGCETRPRSSGDDTNVSRKPTWWFLRLSAESEHVRYNVTTLYTFADSRTDIRINIYIAANFFCPTRVRDRPRRLMGKTR